MTSVFHLAAYYGGLSSIPPSLLTSENLLGLDDAFFTSVLHAAVEGGNLRDIPQQYVTSKNLGTINHCGDTVLHAAFACDISQVDPTLMTPDLLLRENFEGYSVIAYALIHNRLEYIPVTPEIASKYEKLKAALEPTVFDRAASLELQLDRQKTSERWLSKVARLVLRPASSVKPD